MLKKIFTTYLRGKNSVNSTKGALFSVGYLSLLPGKVWWMGPGRVGSSLTEADSTRIKGNGSKS